MLAWLITGEAYLYRKHCSRLIFLYRLAETTCERSYTMFFLYEGGGGLLHMRDRTERRAFDGKLS
jgi:hypothetical protein